MRIPCTSVFIGPFFFLPPGSLSSQRREGREQCENIVCYRRIKKFVGELLGIILPCMSKSWPPDKQQHISEVH